MYRASISIPRLIAASALLASPSWAAPVALDDYYILSSTTLSVPTSGGLLANDRGDSALSVNNYFLPTAGTVNEIRTDGSFRYTPDRGFAGIAEFRYTVIDGSNATSSAVVRIDASTNLPVANNDSYVASSVVTSIAAPGLLANDTGGIGALEVNVFTLPTAGNINRILTDGSFTYTPDRGFAGIASFTYGISDELGRTSRATATIDYARSVPIAVDDYFDVLFDTQFDLLSPGLLANDFGGIGALTFSSYRLPSFGTIDRALTDGSFQYTPPLGFIGLDTFSYSISDELGRTSQANVYLRVGNVPTSVPEPGTGALLVVGLLGLVAARRRGKAA